jgi:transcriptional regulator NrdR family protein
MTCPDCGGPTSILDSRAGPDNTVRRRRRCDTKATCGLRFSTVERFLSYDARAGRSAADRFRTEARRAAATIPRGETP